MSTLISNGHPREFSANVKISLLVGNQSFAVSQVGGGRVWFDCPIKLPAGDGEVVLSIDDQEQRWAVVIPEMHEPANFIQSTFSALA